jgi:hypothetical protein
MAEKKRVSVEQAPTNAVIRTESGELATIVMQRRSLNRAEVWTNEQGNCHIPYGTEVEVIAEPHELAVAYVLREYTMQPILAGVRTEMQRRWHNAVDDIIGPRR